MNEQIETVEEVAIIGMAGRFPGADNVDQFWHNLQNGIESISRFTDEELLERGVSAEMLSIPNYVKAGCLLPNIDMFDAAFFGYSAAEAINLDPQHRLFLEICWEAMEHAGYVPDSCPGAVGVFGGASNSGYAHLLFMQHQNLSATDRFNLMLGTDPDFFATRIAFKLNLKGPALTIQTACSTSLVAIHQACQSLLTYQCDMALAGAVCMQIPQGLGYLHQDGMIFSQDGHCRPFDVNASGTVFGQGAGVVLLKRLSEALQDNDNILAVIKGSAINNDGGTKAGFTAPSADGQAEVIAMAHTVSEVDPATITYIEAHGTGTPLGDPIEIQGLTKAFHEQCQNTGYCAIGSVKSNIGHLDTAAGVAGLIKTILALQHRQIPPTLHFDSPNPQIDWDNCPFYVCAALQAWNSSELPRRAGISSFGVGGTNAHLVLEEAPERAPTGYARRYQLITLSAKTPDAINSMATNLAVHLQKEEGRDLADIAFTLQTGRKAFNHRRFVVAQSLSEATALLSQPNTVKISPSHQRAGSDIIFMFSGQGSQYVNMGRNLYETEPYFREQIDSCAEKLYPHLGLDLRTILYPSPADDSEAQDRLNQTNLTQPALFMVEYCMAQLLIRWGIHPTAMVGHSIGEYVAACISGVFTLDDALRLVAARGRLMQSLPTGSMLAVFLSEEDLGSFDTRGLNIAVVNGVKNCVVSGPTPTIEAFEEQLSVNSVQYRKLHTSHAFHSSMMESILSQFNDVVSQIRLSPPALPFVSNLTGTWISPSEAQDTQYWPKHLRHTVRFVDCLHTILQHAPDLHLIEVGPGQTLCALTHQHPDCISTHHVLPTIRPVREQKDDAVFLLETVGKLWVLGSQIEWQGLYEQEKRHKVPLPTYPFDKNSFWPASSELWTKRNTKPSENKSTQPIELHNDVKNRIPSTALTAAEILELVTDICKHIIPKANEVLPSDNFFDLGGDSLHAVSLFSEIEKRTGINLPIATLFDAKTLEDLAAKFATTGQTELLLRTDNRATIKELHDPWACLVPMQPKGKKPPFFCVHGVGSNALNYRVFIEPLGERQPLYGLQAKGLDGISKPYRSIKGMAIHYLSEIKRVQPAGPYFLGGASFGGLVALEMAQQLRLQGQDVALLILFDTQGPNANITDPENRQPSLVERIKRYISVLRHLPPNRIARRIYSSFSYRFRYIRCLIYRISGKPIPHELRYWHLEQINISAWKKYTPQYYDSIILLFRAYDHENSKYDPSHGWIGMSKSLEIIEIPGEHATFIEKREVGIKLSEKLNAAQKSALG